MVSSTPQDLFNELLGLGFSPRVVAEPDGSSSTFYCRGSLAIRLEVGYDGGPAGVRLGIFHAEWDRASKHGEVRPWLDHHDLSVLAISLPALMKLSALGRGPRLRLTE